MREYQRGLSSGYFECRIEIQELELLRSCIGDLPAEDPVKGYFGDKVRYDYDSQTQLLQLLMSPSEIHEQTRLAIHGQIKDYLADMTHSGKPAIRDFASAVRSQGSAKIEYPTQKDQDYEPSLSASPPIPLRMVRNTRFSGNQSAGSDWGLETIPDPPRYLHIHDSQICTGQSQENEFNASSELVSTLELECVEKHYSPDDAWKFQSPYVEDEQPAFVVEVAHTENQRHLEEKVEGLIRFCNAQAVLVCRTSNSNERGACIELWKPASNFEEGRREKVEPKLAWRVDILDKQGRVVSSSDNRAAILLDDFITPDSFTEFFGNTSQREVEFYGHKTLLIRANELGEQLASLRDKKRKKRVRIAETEARDAESMRRKRQRLRQSVELRRYSNVPHS